MKTLFLALAALAMSTFAPAAEKPPTQGIRGTVVRLSGNFMPGPGPRQGRTEPLSVPVHIFKGAVKLPRKAAKDHPAFLKTVKSDKEGKYVAELEPGQYTVIAEIDGKLYANVMTIDGTLPALRVEKGKWTDNPIQDTSKAAF